MTTSHLKVIGASLGLAAIVSYVGGVAFKTYQVKRELAPTATAFERAADDYTSAQFRLDTLGMSVENDYRDRDSDRYEEQKDEAWSRIEQALNARDEIIGRHDCTGGRWYVPVSHLRSPDTTSPICLNPFSE